MKPRVLALLVSLPLLVVAGRMWLEGSAALREAHALAADPGADARRIDALGRAARRLGGPAGEARELLAALGRAGNALAWEELRSSILATRWLVTPAAALLDEANHALAERRASEALGRRPGAADPQRLPAETDAQHARLVATGEPDRALSLLAILGLIVFVAAIGHGLFAGRSTAALATAGMGLALLVIGLWRA